MANPTSSAGKSAAHSAQPATPAPQAKAAHKPDLKALRERLRHKGDARRGDNPKAEEIGGSGGGP